MSARAHHRLYTGENLRSEYTNNATGTYHSAKQSGVDTFLDQLVPKLADDFLNMDIRVIAKRIQAALCIQVNQDDAAERKSRMQYVNAMSFRAGQSYDTRRDSTDEEPALTPEMQ